MDSRVRAVCYGISSYCSNAMKSANPHSGIYKTETARTLDLNGGNPACNQGGVLVVMVAEDGIPKDQESAVEGRLRNLD